MLAISRIIFSRFIDGTVEGTDITGTKEPNIDRYGTYYGNGCQVMWDDGGSQKACQTRIVQTADYEDQKNGTYYYYPMATAKSNTESSPDNTIVPDTFCPLGWQLPYDGTGGDYYNKSKSWRYLIATYSGEYTPSTDSSYLGSYPFSYIRAGDLYERNPRVLMRQNISGLYLSNTTVGNSSYINFFGTQYRQQGYAYSAGGSIRCDFDISNLEKLSMASAFTH